MFDLVININHCETNDYSVVFDCDNLVTGCIHSQSIIHIDKTLFLQKTQIHDFGIGKLKKEKLRNVMQTWANLVTKSYHNGRGGSCVYEQPAFKKNYAFHARLGKGLLV